MISKRKRGYWPKVRAVSVFLPKVWPHCFYSVANLTRHVIRNCIEGAIAAVYIVVNDGPPGRESRVILLSSVRFPLLIDTRRSKLRPIVLMRCKSAFHDGMPR